MKYIVYIILMWNKAKVKGVLQPVQGLTNRRKDEAALYLSESAEPIQESPTKAPSIWAMLFKLVTNLLGKKQ